MKRIYLLTAVVLMSVIGMTAYAQTTKAMNQSKKSLVAYFSATGTTARAAKELAEAIGADLYAIQPETPYSSADLNWRDKSSRSCVEMANPASRPAIKGKLPSVAAYDVIYIGYPIWWDVAPHIVNTFIESSNLAGKTVVPFATSGGSSVTNSVKELQKAYPAINWRSGRLLNSTSKEQLKQWVASIAQ